jgi:hypothetical protein
MRAAMALGRQLDPLGLFGRIGFEKVGTMGYELREIARKLTAGAVLSVILSAGLSGLAAAQQPAGAPAPAAAKAKAPTANTPVAKNNAEAALKAYSAGTRAFESGKMPDAVAQLSTALSAGGLPSNQMAKALYYRGAAYRKQGKPAMAISDLTSALWLKGGLSDADRALATDARQAAYREAGLGDNAPAIPAQQSAVAAPAVATPATPPAAAPAAASNWQAATSTGADSGAASEPIATLAPAPEAAPAAKAARISAAAPPDGSLSSVVAEPAAAYVPPASASTPAPPAALSEAPSSTPAPDTVQLNAVPGQDTAAAPTGAPLAGAGTAVSGFFNNMGSSIGKMFGGGDSGSQATESSSTSVSTGSTGVALNDAPPATATSSWSEPVVVAPGSAKTSASSKSGAKPAAAAAAPAAPAKTQVASVGNIRLQVAAVRSREEAELVSTRLRGTPAVASAGKQASIDEAVIGNMGTFYRISLGPFANASEPNKLCEVLKPDGYDCLVVSQ